MDDPCTVRTTCVRLFDHQILSSKIMLERSWYHLCNDIVCGQDEPLV
jgi:hypothetical protein